MQTSKTLFLHSKTIKASKHTKISRNLLRSQEIEPWLMSWNRFPVWHQSVQLSLWCPWQHHRLLLPTRWTLCAGEIPPSHSLSKKWCSWSCRQYQKLHFSQIAFFTPTLPKAAVECAYISLYVIATNCIVMNHKPQYNLNGFLSFQTSEACT